MLNNLVFDESAERSDSLLNEVGPLFVGGVELIMRFRDPLGEYDATRSPGVTSESAVACRLALRFITFPNTVDPGKSCSSMQVFTKWSRESFSFSAWKVL